MVNEPISEVEPTTPEVEPEKSELPQLVLPLADMTPEERFRATARLIFLAPDVPPVQPRQRRSELRQLDDMLDRQFSRGRDGRDRDGRDRDRDGRDSRDYRENRDEFDGRDDDERDCARQEARAVRRARRGE